VLWIYAPHWAPIKYQGEWIEFPPYEPACYTDPSWGTNPDATHDCAKPRGPIWKAAWSGVKEKWPGAHKAIQAFKLDNDEMGAMVGKVDVEGQPLEAVVEEWVKSNEPRWRGWIAR
jgi:glycine betaine/proline transport system substrate-binding protein